MPPREVGVRSSHLGGLKKRKEKKKVLPASSCQEVCPTEQKSRAPMRDAASWWNKNGGKRSGLNTPPSSQNSESSSSSSKKKGTWKSQCIPPGPPKTLF